MAKMLKDTELLDIVRRIVEDSEIDDHDQYELFLGQLAEIITEHCGGDVGTSSYDPHDGLGYSVAIRWNDSVPEGGGIFAKYDDEADFDATDGQ